MKGVKGYIKKNIPRSWDIILRRNRCLDKFVDQLYQAIVKQKNKNRYHCNVTIMNARHYIRCYSINSIAIGFNFKEGPNFWNDIANQVSNYEFNCN